MNKKSLLAEISGWGFIVIVVLFWFVIDPRTTPSTLAPYKNIIVILGGATLLAYSFFFIWLKDEDIDTPLARLMKIACRTLMVVILIYGVYLRYSIP